MVGELKMPNSVIEVWGYNNTALTYASGNCTTRGCSAALWKLWISCPIGLFTQAIPDCCHADCWSFSFVMFSNSLQIVGRQIILEGNNQALIDSRTVSIQAILINMSAM